MTAASAPELKPHLAEVVERIGCGPAQLRYCLTGGGVYVADGSELLLISAITESLATDWHLDGFERGFVVTIVYFGMLVGTMSCGPLGDSYGRRICVLSSYVIVIIACLASSCAPNYVTLCAMRFIVGAGIGVGIPAFNALATEITPRKWRMVMQASSYIMFTGGELWSCFLILADDPDMENLHWRSLVRWAAFPGVLFFFGTLICMFESPSFLALNDQDEEGRKTLASNAMDNGLPDLNVDFMHVKPDVPMDKQIMGSQIMVLFNRHLLSTTLVCLFTTFMCNCMYYGSLYAFPQVLQELQTTSGTSTGMQLLIGALWELPGVCLGIVMGLYLRRKLALKISLGCCAVCLFTFALGSHNSGWAASVAWHVGYYGLKCFVQVVYAGAYVFSAEVYPTSVRTTGNALCLAGGRVGAMIAPLVFEKLSEGYGGSFGFFMIMAVLVTFDALIIDFAPFEPTTQCLPETVDEQDKLFSEMAGSSYSG